MCPPPESAAGETRAARAALAAEVRRLGEALQRAQERLVALGGEALPGLHLVIEAAGRRGLLASARVVEVVRLVATAPLAGAPAHVLGTFVCRGAPVVAVDLGALLGATRQPGLDAQIVILAGAPSVGLVVDRVVRLVNGPRLFEGDLAAGTPDSWRGSPLVAGLCVVDGEVLPLVDASAIAAGLAAEAP
jgi:purine-binding chemotaxis protein CheW